MNKCGGCWGWTIDLGDDTIKTSHLPFENINPYLLKYPAKVNIELGTEENSLLGPFPYYQVKCVELVETIDCSDPTIYRFVLGRPHIYAIRASQEIAEEWGFTIQYQTGTCGISPAVQKRAEEYEKMSLPGRACLNRRYQADWETRFQEEVAAQLKKNSY